MSKLNTSRSRTEKFRSNPPAVSASNEIVSGKYSEQDWTLAVEEEDNDNFVFGVVQNLIDGAEKIIHQKYLSQRLANYTVEKAKSAIVKILEWEFLSHDTNEESEDVWIEDDEPETCMIDSCAQGYLPKRQASIIDVVEPLQIIKEALSSEASKINEVEEPQSNQVELSNSVVEAEVVICDENIEIKEEQETTSKTEIETSVTKESIIDEEIAADKTPDTKKKTPFKPYKGQLNFDNFKMLTETLYDTEMRLEEERKQKEIKQKRTSSSQSTSSRKNETIDVEGKVIQKLFSTSIKNYRGMKTSDILNQENKQLLTVMKLPPEQMTVQKIKANHKLIDNSLSSKIAAARLTDSTDMTNKGKGAATGQQKKERSRTPVSQSDNALPISMIDSIEPVPGVTIQEGDRIKKSINRKQDKCKQMEKELFNLNPIKPNSENTTHLIDEIIGGHQMKLKPLNSTPVPPISNTTAS